MLIKWKFKNPRSAQGMVEFALVLPVFLLLVMMLFAVGHYLFTYSFVLSASREAARYGSAVGKADNDPDKYRFQDCDAILDAATRVGGVAGVTDANVTINYDAGPDTATLGNCPAGSFGPASLTMGDRIDVEISMPYEPIVPLITFPNITVRAQTARTIVRAVSVGSTLGQIGDCYHTITTIQSNSANPAVVGELITYTVNVTADGGPPPSLADSIAILQMNPDFSELELCRTDAANGSCQAQFFNQGLYAINARFYGKPDVPCYDPSEEYNYQQTVNKAETNTDITIHIPDPSAHNSPVAVTVEVTAKAPGAGIPTGTVAVSGGGSSCTATLVAGTGTCVIYPAKPTNTETVVISANYPGDGNYNDSSDAVNHTVRLTVPSPTFVSSPTPGPTATQPVVVPTVNPYCPTLANTVRFTSASGRLDEFTFDIRNNHPTQSVDIQSISLTWPDNPYAKLTEVRFAADNSPLAECKNNNHLCLWQPKKAADAKVPPSTTITPSTETWDTSLDSLGALTTREMLMRFDHYLGNGPYKITIVFNSQCTLIINANRTVTTQ